MHFGAAVEGRFNPDEPAHAGDDAGNCGQSESAARPLGRKLGVKHPQAIARIDAGACIRDAQVNKLAGAAIIRWSSGGRSSGQSIFRHHSDGPGRGYGFQGVCQQSFEHHANLLSVPCHLPQLRGQIPLEDHSLAAQIPDAIQDPPHVLVQIDRGHRAFSGADKAGNLLGQGCSVPRSIADFHPVRWLAGPFQQRPLNPGDLGFHVVEDFQQVARKAARKGAGMLRTMALHHFRVTLRFDDHGLQAGFQPARVGYQLNR